MTHSTEEIPWTARASMIPYQQEVIRARFVHENWGFDDFVVEYSSRFAGINVTVIAKGTFIDRIEDIGFANLKFRSRIVSCANFTIKVDEFGAHSHIGHDRWILLGKLH